MAQNPRELNLNHNHHHQPPPPQQQMTHHQFRRIQSSSNRQQISGPLFESPDSVGRNIPFISQSESWRDHYKHLTRQLKEELRQNPDSRRNCCYKDGNSSSHMSHSHHHHSGKNGQQSNGGNKSKIPVKQDGTTLSVKRKISDSGNGSIQRGGDVEFVPRSQLECQVCQLKEIRSNIQQINKVVVEQNEKIVRLKNKYLRYYFQRQMMD